jgi:hypothetical protein
MSLDSENICCMRAGLDLERPSFFNNFKQQVPNLLLCSLHTYTYVDAVVYVATKKRWQLGIFQRYDRNYSIID